MKRLTKIQAKQFARIQSGVLIFNSSGEEFINTDLSVEEIEMLYEFMAIQCRKILRPKEQGLASTSGILEYVRTNF